MNSKPVGHGYSEIEIDNNNPFYKTKSRIKGHEFHYSSVKEFDGKLTTCMKVIKGYGLGEMDISHKKSENRVLRDGLIYKNVLGCYLHIHALGMNNWAHSFVNLCHEYKKQNKAYPELSH